MNQPPPSTSTSILSGLAVFRRPADSRQTPTSANFALRSRLGASRHTGRNSQECGACSVSTALRRSPGRAVDSRRRGVSGLDLNHNCHSPGRSSERARYNRTSAGSRGTADQLMPASSWKRYTISAACAYCAASVSPAFRGIRLFIVILIFGFLARQFAR
jgi:hypothetical protein